MKKTRAVVHNFPILARSLFLFVGMLGISSKSIASGQSSCASVFSPSSATEIVPESLLGTDLLQYRLAEISQLSSSEIDNLNQGSLNFLQNFIPVQGLSNRVQAISSQQMSQVISSMTANPIIRASRSGKYSQAGTEIGYCFGRATYIHLALLKMGVDKNSIRKAWLVGPMKAGGLDWQFHVATVVRGQDGKWYALDDYFGNNAKELSNWFSQFKKMNSEGNLRLYLTDPQKFSISLGPYDRLQLGLSLSSDRDWYRGFFKDLMNYFKTTDLKSAGLEKLK